MERLSDPHAELRARSVAALLTNQHPSGAFLASPDFAQYRYCWLRDGSFVAHALDLHGEHDAAAAFHAWCAESIDGIAAVMEAAIERAQLGKPVDPAAMPPARFGLDGEVHTDGWPNFQIDGYGTWLWCLRAHLAQSSDGRLAERLLPALGRTARYLSVIGTAPCFDVWEENGSSVHTSTLASVYAGLHAAAELLDDAELSERAEAIRSDVLKRARLDHRFRKSSDSPLVDASLLWLGEPFRLVDLDEPAFATTAGEVATDLLFEGGIRRYPTDTYFGGGAWPVLTASLGWHFAAKGDVAAARACLEWVVEHFDRDGRLAEQYGGERRDPEMYVEWTKRWGPPAKNLLWSHAMFLVLSEALRLEPEPADESPATPQ
jgi:GH15 family glucan-1,4-alpha-glucosidase